MYPRGAVAGIIPASAGSTTPASGCPACRRDHPRVCGEHLSANDHDALTVGSSPRLRGARAFTSPDKPGLGIIPASAGSTSWGRGTRTRSRDHPRVCGEHTSANVLTDGSSGSSPRLRGASGGHRHTARRRGIIPASAGSTRRCPSFRRRRWDHPRVCGEHLLAHRRRLGLWGSSPRLRGAHVQPHRRPHAAGIIPASAGSTGTPAGSGWRPQDHPRVCGEHLLWGATPTSLKGSSPRLRGAHGVVCAAFWAGGIIPASAGSTFRRTFRARRRWDHPRVCGEHSELADFAAHTPGSSPRLRGAPRPARHLPHMRGIIPASAGSTSLYVPRQAEFRDHPRVCGEHTERDRRPQPRAGSSPRLRGALVKVRAYGTLNGIIPASAGSTREAAGTTR